LKLYRKHWVIILTTPIAVIVDQLSKIFIRRFFLANNEPMVINRYLNIAYAENKGLAFGMFADRLGPWSTWIFLGITVIALAIIVNLFFRTEQKAALLPAALSLVLAGALGNLIDRFHWGYVVDFIQAHYERHYWPTFNVADIAISAGIVLLIADSLRPQPGSEPKTKSPSQDAKGGAPQ